ncbi:hypothetical protein Gotur_017031 [Gossypium turneri]
MISTIANTIGQLAILLRRSSKVALSNLTSILWFLNTVLWTNSSNLALSILLH